MVNPTFQISIKTCGEDTKTDRYRDITGTGIETDTGTGIKTDTGEGIETGIKTDTGTGIETGIKTYTGTGIERCRDRYRNRC